MEPNSSTGNSFASMDVECGNQHLHNVSLSEEQRVPDESVPTSTCYVTSGVSVTGHVRWAVAMDVRGAVDRIPVAVSCPSPATGFCASPTSLRKRPSLCVQQRKHRIRLLSPPVEWVEPPRSPSPLPDLPPAPPPSPVDHTHQVDGPLDSRQLSPAPSVSEEPNNLEGIDWDAHMQELVLQQSISAHSNDWQGRYAKCARVVTQFSKRVMLRCTKAFSAHDKHSVCRTCPIVIHVTQETRYTTI